MYAEVLQVNTFCLGFSMLKNVRKTSALVPFGQLLQTWLLLAVCPRLDHKSAWEGMKGTEDLKETIL